MPNQPVTVRRWEVVGAFVLVTAFYFYGLHRLENADRGIRESRKEAVIAAAQSSLVNCLDFRQQTTSDLKRGKATLKTQLQDLGLHVTPRVMRKYERRYDELLRRYEPDRCYTRLPIVRQAQIQFGVTFKPRPKPTPVPHPNSDGTG